LKAALKGIAKPMSKFSFVQATCLILYYGLFRYLPASSSRYTRWTRFLRRIVCTPLFRFAGANINVERGAAFGTGRKVSVGNNSGIGINCQIFGEISIGNWVMMGPDVMFITTSHRFDQTDKPMYAQGISGEKKIVINDDVWIGARCIFLPGVSVGQGSVIGAGSVVTKNIPEFSIAAGNPARVLKSRH
jgi:maltose O-acetyltransferase